MLHLVYEFAILKNLRDVDTEKAIEFFEVTLDGKIVSIQICGENTQRTNEAVAKAIEIVSDYRNEHPRNSQNSEIDRMVTKVLNLNAK